MKRNNTIMWTIMFLVILIPSTTCAMGIEAAIGYWRQDPQGDIAYKKYSALDKIDLERDLRYDTENRVMGRLKINTPVFIPNIYIMATQMEFDGTGSKATNFKFGNVVFQSNQSFYSKLTLHHYDIALFGNIPLLQTATIRKLNIELGLNVRVIDFKARIQQYLTGLMESKSYTVPVPMLYAAIQARPIRSFSIEVEARGIALSGDHMYSLIGRVKIKPIGPLFIAGGYRYEDAAVDEKDVDADLSFKGPFVETGFEF